MDSNLQRRVFELELGMLHIQNYVWMAQRYGAVSRKATPKGPLDEALCGIERIVLDLITPQNGPARREVGGSGPVSRGTYRWIYEDQEGGSA